MNDIVEKLKAAAGPDREIDALIWAEVNGRDVRWQDKNLLGRNRRPPHDECWIGRIDPGKVQRNFSLIGGTGGASSVPLYTKSIDIALGLILSGFHWRVGDEEEAIIYKDGDGFLGGVGDIERYGKGCTPAISICIAAMILRLEPSVSNSGDKECSEE